MENLENLCMSCMEDSKGNEFCPNCGASTVISSEEVQYPIALRLKTLLQGRYLVGKSIDINGEGIGYICYDKTASTPVYLREFLPFNLCERADNGKSILAREGLESKFDIMKDQYLNYNRKLASMRGVSCIFPIYDIFKENNTAYIVCEWQENIELTEYVERSGGSLSWNDARILFMPVLSALSELAENGIHHYGINPRNLVILKNGKMRLRGFSVEEERLAWSLLKPELFDGYSAPEQYAKDGKLDESSDVYAFVASLFFALTGEVPQSSHKRNAEGRLLVPTESLKEIPPHVITAIANAMQVNKQLRTAKFEHLRAELSLSPTIKMKVEDIVNSGNDTLDRRKKETEIEGKEKFKLSWPIISIVAVVVLVFSLSLTYISFHSNYTDKKAEDTGSSSSFSIPANNTNQIDIPNLVGTSYEQAKNYGQTQGTYQVKLSAHEFSDTVAEGLIISQSPEYTVGGKMNKGSVVAVVVSKGSETRMLPNVQGKTLSEASAELTKNGFVPQKAVEEYSDKYEEGRVISYQTNKAGDKLEYGSTVNLIVSKGKEQVSSSTEDTAQ